MSDYSKIESAIRFIRDHRNQQPSLDDVAAHVHLSPYHFQRMFSRWAGVTPKRFLQVLTLEHAKSLLHDPQHSLLDTAHNVGLSSGSRLYDHFVQLEAVTPAEYKTGGEGVVINTGYHDTPYGKAFIALTERGICKLQFPDNDDQKIAIEALQQEWPNATLTENPPQTGQVIEQLFNKTPDPKKPLSLWVRGTNFQINVWKALLDIQPGQLTTYSNIAQRINKPSAVRAVGTAIGANPVGLIIPCHRVIRQSGELGGYRWGLARKHAILVRESVGVADI